MKDTWWVKPEQLDENQREIVSLPIEKNFLIIGPPGSGKTNLLLLRANFLVKSGFPDIAILVFTRTLKEFVATGASQYSFSEDKIFTSTSWMMNIINQYDRSIPSIEDFGERRLCLVRETERVVEENNIGKIHEAILLDEAQDYIPEEIDLFHKVSKRIFAVADTKQKIYDGADPLEKLRSIVDETFTLRKHYRNGVRICQLADGLIKDTSGYIPLAKTSNYNEEVNPSTVNLFECKDLEEQCEKIYERLKTQIKAYPSEFIGILSPLRKDVRKIGDYFSNTDLASKINTHLSDEGRLPLVKEKPIVISTIHSAKGLEFRALHLASFESIKKFRKQRFLAYMASTRVKTSLSVYYTGNLPGYFEQADANMKRPPRTPKLTDVFGLEE
jgi:superfamily I DNA/RNA helicase